MFAGSLLISSCKKSGCTDAKASNYSKKAKENCCCEYEGKVVLWYNKSQSDYWKSQGVTTLKYYLDDELIFTRSPNEFWTGPPVCDDNGTLTFTSKSDATMILRTIDIYDQNGDKVGFRQCNFYAGECSRQEL